MHHIFLATLSGFNREYRHMYRQKVDLQMISLNMYLMYYITQRLMILIRYSQRTLNCSRIIHQLKLHTFEFQNVPSSANLLVLFPV